MQFGANSHPSNRRLHFGVTASFLAILFVVTATVFACRQIGISSADGRIWWTIQIIGWVLMGSGAGLALAVVLVSRIEITQNHRKVGGPNRMGLVLSAALFVDGLLLKLSYFLF